MFGIVTQNCNLKKGCKKGVGWAETRHLEDVGPDSDCINDFCASEFGKPHCDAGRIRILRLDEHQALGPFFARYLASKLWLGENFFLQIDSHTKFAQGWDVEMVKMMRRTRSYPKSVISNYPPSGVSDQFDETNPPGSLCACTFEGSPGRLTIRLGNGGGYPSTPYAAGQHPRYSAFVAAGFYVAHSSFLEVVPFDPYMPWIFMGEEIMLSSRLWTNGFDIHAPTVDFLQHEYVRKDQSKFWETVGLVFGQPGIHNDLVDLIIPRMQYQVGYPERQTPGSVQPAFLLDRAKEYGQGTADPARSLSKFNRMVGLDLERKSQNMQDWCGRSNDPPIGKYTRL